MTGVNLRIGVHPVEIPERHKVEVFERLPASVSLDLARERGGRIIEELGHGGVAFTGWDEICRELGWSRTFEMVFKCFQGTPSFRRHCLSQTFSNLQPRFRKIGVEKKNEAQVERCACYLLEELALKACLFSSDRFAGEIMPSAENGLVLAVYGGKYFPCSREGALFELVHHDGERCEISTV